MAAELQTDVLIVGAGPTGLMLANWLAKLGVDHIIADGKPGPTRESRALGVQARSMEIYDQLGIAGTVMAEGVLAEAVVIGFGTKPRGRVPLGRMGRGITPFPGIMFYEQSKNEELLLKNLRAIGGAVLWECRLAALDVAGGSHPDHPVSARLTGPAGEASVRARYCVGTDGASSTVRASRGIGFEGSTSPQTFFVDDATEVRGLFGDVVNIRAGVDEFLLAFPMSGPGHLRLIGVVRDPEGQGRDNDGGADVSEESLRERLIQKFGVRYGASNWFSTYRVHHRIAARFRDGPVFLAGDAAHVHSPVGAQGMNTGLQDAHNLAFKFADVLAGRAADSYLDRYEAERRPVAVRLLQSTDRVFAFITSTAPWALAARRSVLPFLIPVVARVVPRSSGRARLFGYISQTRIHYWMAPGAKEAARGRRGRVVGRRLPYTGSNFDVLRSLQWQVHSYGDPGAVVVNHVEAALGLTMHVLPRNGNKKLAPEQLYLVRPDGFVAAQALPSHAVATFTQALRRGRRSAKV
jgi:2-polyprenyl-6-methoxyphenol hydroxylase-like FAD-dependent oxidoreductase